MNGLVFWLMVAFGIALTNEAEPAEQPVKLTGIVVEPTTKYALLEKHENHRPPKLPILRQGESWEGFEVISIDENAAAVTLREGKTGQPLELKLDLTPGEEMALRTFHFQGAHLRQVLEVYQQWSGRTVIASWALPSARLDLKTGPALGVEPGTETLEQALAEKGLFTKPHGDKFIFVFRTNQVQVLSSLARLPVADATQEEVFPPGLIKFMEADLLQVLDVYQELTGRTILRPDWMPLAKITVRSQTALTRHEVVWMLDAVLLLADVAMVAEGEKFVFAVPPGKMKKLPKFDLAAGAAKAIRISKPGLMKFENADRQQLLEVYATLLGRESLPLDPTLPSAKFSVRSQTALQPSETIFVLEAMAALNYLAFELVEEDKVRMIPAAQARK